MRIAVNSASASVARTLEAIITQSGHHLAKDMASADFLIEDTLHPAAPVVGTVPSLQLMDLSTTAAEHSMPCPLRPERLIQRLAVLGTMQSLPLSEGWSLDMLARTLQHTDSRTSSLTEKECSLLKHLALSYPVPMSRDSLLVQVWGMQGHIDTHTLETHIYRLRAKLNELTPPPCDIITQHGAYALVFGPNND